MSSGMSSGSALFSCLGRFWPRVIGITGCDSNRKWEADCVLAVALQISLWEETKTSREFWELTGVWRAPSSRSMLPLEFLDSGFWTNTIHSSNTSWGFINWDQLPSDYVIIRFPHHMTDGFPWLFQWLLD